MEYRDFNDNELLSYIAESDEFANEILFKKYEPLIKSIAKKMYRNCHNCGLEMNDLIQEGMLGFNLAILNFDKEKDNTFYTYAKTIVERKMINVIIGTKRLNTYSLNT